jgi:hypothetical protein
VPKGRYKHKTVSQEISADRDAFGAGHDLTINNYYENRQEGQKAHTQCSPPDPHGTYLPYWLRLQQSSLGLYFWEPFSRLRRNRESFLEVCLLPSPAGHMNSLCPFLVGNPWANK